MIEISLLPLDEQARQKAAQKGLGFEVPRFIPKGFAISIGILVLLYVFFYLRASAVSRTLTNSRRTLEELKEASVQAQAIESKLGPAPGSPLVVERPGVESEKPKDSGERLRKRAGIFRTHLENRKVWSQILLEITLTCPEPIRLTEVKLAPSRTGTSGKQTEELVIAGFYATGGNLEMLFRENLRSAETIGAHYKNLVTTTRPERDTDRTYFWIHCREQ